MTTPPKKKFAYTEDSAKARERFCDTAHTAWQERARRNIEQRDIDLTSGSPGSPPFPVAIAGATNALMSAETMNHYWSAAGTFRTSDTLEPYFTEWGIVPPDGKGLHFNNFAFGNGVTHLFSTAVKTLLHARCDVLLVPLPTYGYFLDIAQLCGKKVVTMELRAKDNFEIDPQHLDITIQKINRKLDQEAKAKGETLTPRVNAFLHINPHNPSGAVHDKEKVEAIATVLQKNGIELVIDDMVYKGTEYAYGIPKLDADIREPRIKYPMEFHKAMVTAGMLISLFEGHNNYAAYTPEAIAMWASQATHRSKYAYPMAAVPGMYDKTLTLTGLSKAYGLPALRAAVAVGPAELVQPIVQNIKSTTEFINIPSQVALHWTFSPHEAEQRLDYLEACAQSLLAKHLLIKLFAEHSPISRKDVPDPILRDMVKGLIAVMPVRIDATAARKCPAIAPHHEERPSHIGGVAWSKELDELAAFTQSKHSLPITEYAASAQDPAMQDIALLRKGIKGMKLLGEPDSGFFQLVDFSAWRGKYYGHKPISNGLDLYSALVEDCGIAILPGETFSCTGNRLAARISFSLKEEDLVQGLTCIARFAEKLQDKPYSLQTAAAPSWARGR